jgi:meiotically up-regulated gene 157 (Mug157) protein
METTVQHFNLTKGHEETYIITGDIEAMWLRDSTNQFLPYLRMPKDCPNLKQLALGLINTQA